MKLLVDDVRRREDSRARKMSYVYEKRLLDHGYIRHIEDWGSDEGIVEAARMSTGRVFNGWGELKCSCGETSTSGKFREGGCTTERGGAHVALPDSKPGDEKLLRFLYENRHMSPFEMAGATFEVQAPIFVFREWHRHRTQSYNEMSARYTPLPDVNYMPTTDRCIVVNGTNKQAQGHRKKPGELTHEEVLTWLEHLQESYDLAQRVYEEGLHLGIPKEVARLPVPVGRYSRMRASANLRNWLQFLTLRSAPNAQWEIRQYADSIGQALTETFPRTMALFFGT
jgi:thymidylate synthase (FAD)